MTGARLSAMANTEYSRWLWRQLCDHVRSNARSAAYAHRRVARDAWRRDRIQQRSTTPYRYWRDRLIITYSISFRLINTILLGALASPY